MCDELIKEHILDYLVGDKDYWNAKFDKVIAEIDIKAIIQNLENIVNNICENKHHGELLTPTEQIIVNLYWELSIWYEETYGIMEMTQHINKCLRLCLLF